MANNSVYTLDSVKQRASAANNTVLKSSAHKSDEAEVSTSTLVSTTPGERDAVKKTEDLNQASPIRAEDYEGDDADAKTFDNTMQSISHD